MEFPKLLFKEKNKIFVETKLHRKLNVTIWSRLWIEVYLDILPN